MMEHSKLRWAAERLLVAAPAEAALAADSLVALLAEQQWRPAASNLALVRLLVQPFAQQEI